MNGVYAVVVVVGVVSVVVVVVVVIIIVIVIIIIIIKLYQWPTWHFLWWVLSQFTFYVSVCGTLGCWKHRVSLQWFMVRSLTANFFSTNKRMHYQTVQRQVTYWKSAKRKDSCSSFIKYWLIKLHAFATFYIAGSIWWWRFTWPRWSGCKCLWQSLFCDLIRSYKPS